jgi:hypothetical protein
MSERRCRVKSTSRTEYLRENIMADTQTTTIEGVHEYPTGIALASKTYYGEAELSFERIEHNPDEVSFFVRMEDVESSVAVSYPEEKIRALRDFLSRQLGE